MAYDRDVFDAWNAICIASSKREGGRMLNQAKQANIPTPSRLADNLIGSLDDLTAFEGSELRRQVVMLINHSYALGYAAGAGAGLVARMQSRLALARRRAGQDIKVALSAICERLAMALGGLQIKPAQRRHAISPTRRQSEPQH
jgi:hypothetical protein